MWLSSTNNSRSTGWCFLDMTLPLKVFEALSVWLSFESCRSFQYRDTSCQIKHLVAMQKQGRIAAVLWFHFPCKLKPSGHWQHTTVVGYITFIWSLTGNKQYCFWIVRMRSTTSARQQLQTCFQISTIMNSEDLWILPHCHMEDSETWLFKVT